MVDNPVDRVWTNPADAGGKSYPPFVRKIIHNLSTSCFVRSRSHGATPYRVLC